MKQMIKFSVIIGLLVSSQVAFAQLKVDAAGNVGIGTTSSLDHKLTIDGGVFLWGNINAGSSSNVSVGRYAFTSNTTGNYNTANGAYALSTSTTGSNNVAIGYYALYSNTTGGNNTAHGYMALSDNTTGGCNTAIGNKSGVNYVDLTNATAIGYNAKVNASNKVVIGNTSVTSIVGGNNITIVSDGRTKKNIRAEVPGLAFINRLQPVMYNFDLDVVDELLKSDDPKINHFRDSIRAARSPEEKEVEAKAKADKEKIVYSGFIAQDVEEAARSMGYDFSGVDAPENGKGPYGLRYAEFVVPLVKAVQELSEQVTELKAEIEELKTPKLRSAEVIIDEGEDENTVNASIMQQQAQLYQNTPNPFNQSTQIKFFVPENVGKAMLCIYDLQGKQLKQTVLTQRGYGIETVFASEFPAGIYLYALLADGNQVDVKRMILTE